MSRRRRRRHRSSGRAARAPAEPFPSPWVECGGELYFAVDFTPAGFPIGLRLEELEAATGDSPFDLPPLPPERRDESRENTV